MIVIVGLGFKAHKEFLNSAWNVNQKQKEGSFAVMVPNIFGFVAKSMQMGVALCQNTTHKILASIF
jgi:hypothetical protein